MNEWKRILSNRQRRIAILCIPILCLALFFYQKSGGNFCALAEQAQDYRALLDAYSGNTPAEIAQALSASWDPTANERRLLIQAEHLRDYSKYLERVQKQAADLQASSLFNQDKNSFVYRNIQKTAVDFASCTADRVCLGNDRAIQDWLAFSWADWGFLAMVLLLVMSFLEERKKGLIAIVRSCPAGREKLQYSRLIILMLYSAGMTLLLYYLPLLVSMCLDGGWNDLFRPIQSLAEFQKCTAQRTVFGFLMEFFFVKTACGFLLGILLWFLLSFLGQIQLCWFVTAAGLTGEYILYTLIPPQSLFSPLRYVNVFSYVFTTKLYTQYVSINFFSFPVPHRTFLLALLTVLAIVFGGLTIVIQIKRYPFGNRDWLGKWLDLWNRLGDAVRRKLGLYGYEWYKLLFLSAGGIILFLGLVLTRDIPCNSGAYNRLEDAVYRQYIRQIQGPVSQSTFDYVSDARDALEYSGMNSGEFGMALDQLEEALAGMDDGDWLVDETSFMNIYGREAWRVQRQNGLLAMLLLAASLSPLFACEQSGDVRKILHSTAGGRSKLFQAKYTVALSVTLLVWLLVFGGEWRAAARLLGNTILAAPCGSIEILKGFPMQVGTFLILLYISKGLALLIPMHFCIFIGERSKGFERAFLATALALLLPAAAYHFGADALRLATPLFFLSDGNLLLSGSLCIVLFVIWAVLSVLALLAAKRNWCR